MDKSLLAESFQHHLELDHVLPPAAASDRAIAGYAADIWEAKPCPAPEQAAAGIELSPRAA